MRWISPRREDDFAEYRDAAFLRKLGLGPESDALAAFWPSRGPQWDALGVAGNAVVLVEAKAHIGEFLANGTQAGAASRARIEAAFAQVQADLGAQAAADWTGPLYQYANRLAHLWWLRARGHDAHLALVGFLGDAQRGGPEHAETWAAAYRVAEAALGLSPRHRLSAFIHHLTPRVSELEGTS